MSTPTTRFRLAPMSPLILVLTLFLLALPAAFLALSTKRGSWLALPALLLLGIYAWVWLWFRPTFFEVHPGVLEVIWPLRRRQLRREEISAAPSVRGPSFRDLPSDFGNIAFLPSIAAAPGPHLGTHIRQGAGLGTSMLSSTRLFVAAGG
jgi:hypothetical protein